MAQLFLLIDNHILILLYKIIAVIIHSISDITSIIDIDIAIIGQTGEAARSIWTVQIGQISWINSDRTVGIGRTRTWRASRIHFGLIQIAVNI